MRKRLALFVGLPLILLSSLGIAGILSAQESERAAVPPAVSHGTGSRIMLADMLQPSTSPRKDPPPPKGTPLEVAFSPDRIVRGQAIVYRVSAERGVLASTDGGATWDLRNVGLPTRMVYPFEGARPPLITCLAVDPTDDSRVALSLPDSVFKSEDAGKTWEKIPVKSPIKPNDQITCVALNPSNRLGLAVGTSFNGFFETQNEGKDWTDHSEKLGFMYYGGGTYEEITSLAYDPRSPSVVYFALGFGKGLYRTTAGPSESITFPGDQTRAPIVDISFHRADPSALESDWLLEVRTDDARWTFDPGPGPEEQRAIALRRYPAAEASGLVVHTHATNPWKLVEMIAAQSAPDPAKIQRAQTASGKAGLYVSATHASGSKLDNLIAVCKRNGLNSMVVDFKDDFGYLRYNSNLAEPLRIKAVRPSFNAEELIQKTHAAGLYLIARIPIFKDEQLYNADSYANATWDRVSNQPWRYLKTETDDQTGEEQSVQSEYWVDPYSAKVWQYNVDIAAELQARGVDEIQFDYIRFPSDGDLSRITYRYQKTGMGKVEALESFLAKAREALTIPISVDVYGYCGWARISGWVAQNIEVFSHYVDAVAPMYYPSHFPRDFLGKMQYLQRANFIYREGGDRAARIVAGRCVIRPYVQAFLIGGELDFSEAVYGSYLVNELQGVTQSAASGFTLWNASNDYYMITSSLTPYVAPPANHPAQGGPQ